MSDISKMQADAANRAKEMYSRRTPQYNTNSFPSGYNGSIKKHEPKTSEEAQEETQAQNDNASKPEQQETVNPTVTPTPLMQTDKDFLDTILADKEKALIILLIALLNEENVSSSLLLALMYLVI